MKQQTFGQKINKQKGRISRFAGILALLYSLAAPCNILAVGWGLERGRADEGDVATLLVDQVAMKMARSRIDRAIADPLKLERQRQLLNLPTDDGRSPDQLVDGVYAWWMQEVMTPAQRIALNPAASCAEAQSAMTTLLGMVRQRQLFGIEDGEARSGEISRIFEATNELGFQRCREEALDECVVSGRFEQIISTAVGQERQAELLGGTAELEEWVDNSLKQCAVYELRFVSTLKTAQIFNLETVRRSKMEIKFDIPARGVLNALKGHTKMSDLLKGETLGDVLLDSAKCTQPGINVVCKSGRVLSQNKAGVVNLDMEHREYSVDGSGISKVLRAGDDKFAFEFGGGIFGVDGAVVVPGYGTVPFPMTAIGYGFYIAHKKDIVGTGQPGEGSTVKVENYKRGVYPVLFEFTYADQGGVPGSSFSDTTEFKLVHKPKPAPLPAKEDKKKTPLRQRKPGM